MSKSVSNVELIGESDVSEWAQRKEQVNQIKQEINNFGITDKERYLLIYLLSLEIENVENSRSISKLVLKLRPDILITNGV